MQNNNLEDSDFKELLQNKIVQKFGKQVKYSKDCKLLSEKVYEATGRQLSVSTIKRFFGLILSPFKPSKYTLDSFSDYLGIENWESFIEANKVGKTVEIGGNSMEMLKKSFQSITETSCNSLALKSKFNSEAFIYRHFAESHFEEFIQSGKIATMLIAPTGYGKSVVLLQWVNTYFSGKDDRFRDDIVCLIDGAIFFTFYNQAQENELLTQLFEFDFETIKKLHLRQKTNDNKVRYFLIIDDIDKIFSAREKYYMFVENIMSLIMLNQDTPWFKIILTCRPENFDTFTSLINNNPLLADAFFKVNFNQKNHFDTINFPLFSDDEINEALVNVNSNISFNHLSFYYPDVLDIINTPSFFSYMVHNENSPDDEFSEINFLNHLIQHFFYSNPFAEEKQQLIKKFLNLCSLNEGSSYVEKDLLLEDTEWRLAYQEFIKAGLLYEYFDSNDLPGVRLKVRFSNNIIFEYSLTRALIRETDENTTLLHTIFTKYRHTISLQYSLLKWLVKIAFFKENINFLKQVHQLMERQVNISNELINESMPGALRSIHTAFIEGLRSYKISGESLMSVFAKSRLGQRLYFEEYFDMDNLMFFPESSLEIYAQNNTSPEGKMIIKFIRFIKGFYSLDYNKCSSEFKSISEINYTELNSSLCLGYYFSSWFLYASMNNIQSKGDMLRMFLSSSASVRSKGSHTLRFNPGLEYYLIYSLNTGNFFDEIRFVADSLFDTYNFNHNTLSCFDQYFKLCYARALLHTGEQERALKLFRHVNYENFPFHIKHFMKLHVNLAKYDFLEYQKNINEASDLLAETRLLATQMGYSYFVQKTEEIEANLPKVRKDMPR